MREKLLAASLTERHARALLRLPAELWEETVDRVIARHLNVEATERLVEELLSETDQKKRKPRRVRGMLRDVRVFYNSVDKAVELLRRCGVSACAEKREEEKETVLVIRIPRSV